MEHKNTEVSRPENWSQNSTSGETHSLGATFLAWWYRLAAPPEPPATASFSQKEKARHGKLAAITVPLLMLMLLSLLSQAIFARDFVLIMPPCVGLGVCTLVLFLNREGHTNIAGILILILQYTGWASTILIFSGGLTLDNFNMIDFSVISYVLVLAFFPTNSIFLIFCLNILGIWATIVLGYHNATITHLLQTAPLQLFVGPYILQLMISIVLYLWSSSSERALARADRAEEIAAFVKREQERQEQELERKRQLDAGIQQILQTHIEVANGNLKVRAPLGQDHVLWQVAVSLNNLIARLQSLSYTERKLERELRLQQDLENERITGHHPKYQPAKTKPSKPDDATYQAHKRNERESTPPIPPITNKEKLL